jgi:carotenoid cleavage dioxygenase
MRPNELPLHEIPALSGNNAPVPDELSIERLEVEGELPADLNGLYVRSGPNPYYPPDWRYHAYDGDGMLHAVRLDRGRASYRNRCVRTAGLTKEQAAGRALWKGIKEPLRADRPEQPLKNTSNTDVKFHAGRLITMWCRSGPPYAVDPKTLETIGPADHQGATPSISAHSRPDEPGRSCTTFRCCWTRARGSRGATSCVSARRGRHALPCRPATGRPAKSAGSRPDPPICCMWSMRGRRATKW